MRVITQITLILKRLHRSNQIQSVQSYIISEISTNQCNPIEIIRTDDEQQTPGFLPLCFEDSRYRQNHSACCLFCKS